MLVAGIDSSTQSTKVVLCDAADGTVVGSGSAPHPPGTEVDPQTWWYALQQAGNGLLNQAAAVAVAGQQHGWRWQASSTGRWSFLRMGRYAALAQRGMAFERLDQPALEHLYGVR
jgi:hypothetical protein